MRLEGLLRGTTLRLIDTLLHLKTRALCQKYDYCVGKTNGAAFKALHLLGQVKASQLFDQLVEFDTLDLLLRAEKAYLKSLESKADTEKV